MNLILQREQSTYFDQTPQTNPFEFDENIKRCLEKPPNRRNISDLRILYTYMEKNPFFNTHYIQTGQTETVANCCQRLKYQFNKKGDRVINIGGSVGIYTTKQFQLQPDNVITNTEENENEMQSPNIHGSPISYGSPRAKRRMNIKMHFHTQPQNLAFNDHNFQMVQVLSTGGSFGELALITREQRQATVMCHTDCHLAWLDRAQFVNILQEKEERRLMKEVSKYSLINIFSFWSLNNLRTLYLNTFRKNYVKKDIIASEQGILEGVYVIQKGEVKRQINLGDYHQNVVAIKNFKPHEFAHKQESDRKQCTISILGQGQVIGYEPFMKKQKYYKKMQEAEESPKQKVNQFKEKYAEEDVFYSNYTYEVLSNEVECIFIKQIEFFEIVLRDDRSQKILEQKMMNETLFNEEQSSKIQKFIDFSKDKQTEPVDLKKNKLIDSDPFKIKLKKNEEQRQLKQKSLYDITSTQSSLYKIDRHQESMMSSPVPLKSETNYLQSKQSSNVSTSIFDIEQNFIAKGNIDSSVFRFSTLENNESINLDAAKNATETYFASLDGTLTDDDKMELYMKLTSPLPLCLDQMKLRPFLDKNENDPDSLPSDPYLARLVSEKRIKNSTQISQNPLPVDQQIIEQFKQHQKPSGQDDDLHFFEEVETDFFQSLKGKFFGRFGHSNMRSMMKHIDDQFICQVVDKNQPIIKVEDEAQEHNQSDRNQQNKVTNQHTSSSENLFDMFAHSSIQSSKIKQIKFQIEKCLKSGQPYQLNSPKAATANQQVIQTSSSFFTLKNSQKRNSIAFFNFSENTKVTESDLPGGETKTDDTTSFAQTHCSFKNHHRVKKKRVSENYDTSWDIQAKLSQTLGQQFSSPKNRQEDLLQENETRELERQTYPEFPSSLEIGTPSMENNVINKFKPYSQINLLQFTEFQKQKKLMTFEKFGHHNIKNSNNISTPHLIDKKYSKISNL